MTHSPRHNVGSVADPHWVVDEEHYLKAVADSDHFFACWQDTLEQRDKAREDALDEAAKVCDSDSGRHFLAIGITQGEQAKHILGAKSACAMTLAAAIRAMKKE